MGQNPNPKQGGFHHAATQNLCRSLNHFGSLSDLAATLGATVVGETLCFSGPTGQAVSDLMEQHGLDYNYSGTPEAANEADQ